MMTNFDFTGANNLVSNSKAPLAGGDIHRVLFKGVTKESFEGKKAETKGMKFEVMNIKFENENGAYTETIFTPKDADQKRRENEWNGQTIQSASRMEEIVTIVTQLITALNPEGMEKLKGKEIGTFDKLIKAIQQLTDGFIDKEVELKLILNKKGKARLPFLAKINKEGKLYSDNKYIGEGLFFTDKEIEGIEKIKSANPTNSAALLEKAEETYESGEEDFDFDGLDEI